MALLPSPGTAIGFYLLLWLVILIVPFFMTLLRSIIADMQVFIGVAGLLQAALMIFVLVVFAQHQGLDLGATLGLRRVRFGVCVWASVGVISVGMVGGVLLWPVIEAMPWLISKELEFLVQLSRFSAPVVYLFYALSLSVGPALSEELAFRGLILQGLRSGLGAVSAVVLSALFFGVIHLDPLQGLGAFITGLYLGYLTVRSGSIYPAIAAHGVNNLWATLEASMRQAFNPQLSPKEILLSAGYPWWAYGVAGIMLLVALYKLHRAGGEAER
ncbi:MAG: CPBP family intramembrane metalloprotease [Candidatus Bipolaricaulota bacterium]|nr:CPBP family intramembrane metalloprotease [Candidatus Bipolaricaulota bacterium]MDW8031301.1 type II CAAX endopeptidase family protein [Candidatus Bipolaricaulota bacterium]